MVKTMQEKSLPLAAAEIAAGLGIRIYTIGIGSTGRVELEYTDPNTGQVIPGIYEGTFDEQLLRDIAARTGGRFFRASSSSSLENIFKSIETIETVQKAFSAIY
jgi:Ca-activated chloride channel family protein